MANKYQRIVDLMLKAMEDETTWRKTWQSQSRLHCNWISKRPYTGSNQMTTMVAGAVHGYTCPYWVTYQQAVQLGGNVKGQKATPAIFMGKGVDRDDPEKSYKFAKVYNIFNLEQIGIEIPEPQPLRESNAEPVPIPDAIQVKVDFQSQHNPSYSPTTDIIKMPFVNQFDDDESFQSTLLHECIHATGHNKRLDRKLSVSFGSEDYAKEELVAELGSVFLCAELGIKYDVQQHASYLSSWQKAIKDDDRYVVTAAAAAQKAVQYCMSQLDLMRQHEAA